MNLLPSLLTISNQNLPPLHVARKAPGWFEQVLHEVGADAYLWSETASVHPAAVMRGGMGRILARRGLIAAVQQSWLTERPSDIPNIMSQAYHDLRTPADTQPRLQQGVAVAKDTALKLALIAGVPHITTSLDRLTKITRQHGHRLPAIAHPNMQSLGNRPTNWSIDYPAYAAQFPELAYQLTAEEVARRGIDPQADTSYLADRLRQHPQGFTTTVLDGNHLFTTRGGHAFRDPIKLAAALARRGTTHWVQVGWQPDLAVLPHEADHIHNQLDLTLQGRFAQTDQGQMLAAVNANATPEAPIQADVEVTSSLLAAHGMADYIKGLRRITSQVRASLPVAFN